MKTAKIAFSGFPRDEFTTLPETDDRLLATKVTATWRYDPSAIARQLDFTCSTGPQRDVARGVCRASQRVRCRPRSGSSASDPRAASRVSEVTMTLPNLHHWLADLSRFGLPNDREISSRQPNPSASSRQRSAARADQLKAAERARPGGLRVTRAPVRGREVPYSWASLCDIPSGLISRIRPIFSRHE